MLKKLIIFFAAFVILGISSVILGYKLVKSGLPEIIKVDDYKPLLVTQVYDKNNKKIGEFSRQPRIVIPFDQIPKQVVQAFVAAEDDQFFEHSGLNYLAILRAVWANVRAGGKAQGGSTITQQLTKNLLLTSEKTLLRKAREALLALEIEKNLTKEEILYLYLNQIYFGHNAYGIERASQNYFRKPAKALTLPEIAILAGLPQAPSRYSPLINPKSAKDRQEYVLSRMAKVGYISEEEAKKAVQTPVKVYLRENYEELVPHYLETVRLLLIQKLGEEAVLDQGLHVFTSVDLEKQIQAQEALKQGLKDLDKRQGYRGPLESLTEDTAIADFLSKEKEKLIRALTPERTILPDGSFADIVPKPDPKVKTILPPFYALGKEYKAIVKSVDDKLGLVYLQMPDVNAIIDFDTMMWARKPNTQVRYDLDQIKKPSDALKTGDLVLVKITSDKFLIPNRITKQFTESKQPLPDYSQFITAELEQEPIVDGGVVSLDQQTQEILALVGGNNFATSKLNRALQAKRQTGSSFKTIVYTAALDKNYTPSTAIIDAPLVYEENNPSGGDEEGQEDQKVWKPTNHSKKFGGDILFRNALVQSLNVPTVKIIEDIGVPYVAEYARRLGIFNQLNMDFTLALGSSGITLYEMTKVFSQLGRLGKRIRPLLIHKVLDKGGQKLLEKVSLDARFEEEMKANEDYFAEQRRIYFENPESEEAKKMPAFYFENEDQLISPQTAFIATTLLRATIEDKNGTGARARSLGREVAGKTGTTNGYFDAWFIGYTPQISTGVWIGFDQEKTLGKGEVGGRSALPVWLQYMKAAHEDLPQMTFPTPDGIVIANIDNETGKLASSQSKEVVRQAYKEGTEPTAQSNKEEENTDFLKQDLNE